MPLITPQEFKASLEARQAGLDSVPDEELTPVIADMEAELYEVLGYEVASDAVSVTTLGSGKRTTYLPHRVRSMTSVSESGVALVSGEAYLTAGGFAVKRRFGRWAEGETVLVTAGAGNVGFTEGERWRILAEKVLRRFVVRYLNNHGEGYQGFEAPPGAYVTGYQSENAAIQFYTPGNDPDTDRIIQLIKHPKARDKAVHSSPLVATAHGGTPFPNQNA